VHRFSYILQGSFQIRMFFVFHTVFFLPS
jgi:hypothetical protein